MISETETGIYMPLATPCPRPRGLPPDNDLQLALFPESDTLRSRCILLFAASFFPYLQRIAEAMADCGRYAKVIVNRNTGATRMRIYRCHKWYCPACAAIRTLKVAARIRSIIMDMNRPREMVLTLKSLDRPLAEQLRRLRRLFHQVRDDPVWKQYVTGGIYTFEVTLNLDNRLWHPHIHIIFDGKYFPHARLKALWNRISHDSEIVWLEPITDAHKGAFELAKYIGKPIQAADWTNPELLEYADAVFNMHMVQTFGNQHAQRKGDVDLPDLEPPPEADFDLSHLVYLTRLNTGHVADFVILIAQRWPNLRSYVHKKLRHLEIPLTCIERFRRSQPPGHPRAPPDDLADQHQAEIEKLEPQLARLALIILAEDDQGIYLDAAIDAQYTGQAA